MSGEATFDDLSAVKERDLNLSVSDPDTIPQWSAFSARPLEGMFTTKSPVSLMSRFEWRLGRRDILMSGGSEQTIPHHATVTMLFLLLPVSMQLTRTTGVG